MHLDLSSLRQRHPLLPVATALEYVHRAALGLGRSGHRPGCSIALEIDGSEHEGTAGWPWADPNDLKQLDKHRVTEDAAEAISLVLVHVAENWRTVRRLQRDELADWLLMRSVSGRQETMALEISGLAEGSPNGRLRDKLAQVSACLGTDKRAAAVVGLEHPTILFRTLEEST